MKEENSHAHCADLKSAISSQHKFAFIHLSIHLFLFSPSSYGLKEHIKIKKKKKEKVNARRKSEISSTNKHLDICWRNTMYLAQDFTAAKTEGYLWSVIFKLMIKL